MTTTESDVRSYRVKRQLMTKAVRWDGGNLAALRSMLTVTESLDEVGERGYLRLQVHGRPDRIIEPGMWLHRELPGGGLYTASDDVFRHLYEETPDA